MRRDAPDYPGKTAENQKGTEEGVELQRRREGP